MRNQREIDHTENMQASEAERELRTTFVAPDSLIKAVRLVAKRNDRTLSAEIRQALRDLVESEAA